MIRILMIDDHNIFRSGLRRLFQDERDIEIVAEASKGQDGLALLRNVEVDLVLLDINLPEISGFEVLRLLREEWPGMPVLLLSMYRGKQYSQSAIKAGANAYLSKDCDPDQLIEAIRTVAAGRKWLDHSGSGGPAAEQGKAVLPHTKLSTREYQVLIQIAQGTSLTHIAQGLGVSVKTVATYRQRILEKFEITSNAELASYALLHQLQ